MTVYSPMSRMECSGTNHAVVGYFLARRWQLPDFLVEGILYHHDYSVLGKPDVIHDTARALIAVCVLAEHIIRLHSRAMASRSGPRPHPPPAISSTSRWAPSMT